VDCSRNDCDRIYHLNCAIGLSDASWSYEGKLVCPQHVSYCDGFFMAAVSVFKSLGNFSEERKLLLYFCFRIRKK
jgi:hypothetical protein